MKQIQYVSKYIALAEEGLFPKVECPMDQGSLLCNQDLDDEIFLYCLSCEYKKTIGIDFYEKMVAMVNANV